MNAAHRQLPYDVRFDWGIRGGDAIAPGVAVAVVVDVLSFTTTLSVAIELGIEVIPCRSRDESAAEVARARNATLAVGRTRALPGEISLSPATLRRATPPERLVLPSPNGSSIAAHLAIGAGLCVGGSFRNATAVAKWIAENTVPTDVISVIAAGEQWPGGELRPSIEDLWGSGCIVSALNQCVPERTLSPEAQMAVSAWNAVSDDISEAVHASASGRELVLAGFREDVEIACEIDVSNTVPALRSGVFTDVRRL